MRDGAVPAYGRICSPDRDRRGGRPEGRRSPVVCFLAVRLRRGRADGKGERGMWRVLASLLRLFGRRTVPCPSCARPIERTRLKCPYCATWLE